MSADWDLETLLSLDGAVYDVGGGLWWKVEAKKIKPTPSRPHGIKYSLTLHDSDNRRIFGIDNAHGLKKKSNSPGAKRRVEFNHFHEGKTVKEYDYRSTVDLMNDFYDVVDKERLKRGIK